jgi:hypothetical protein
MPKVGDFGLGFCKQVRIDHRQEPGFINSQSRRLTSLDKTASSIERRGSPRLKSDCEAQVIADLSILDGETHSLSPPLVFLGQTTNVSLGGVGIVFPSLVVDERFCHQDNLIQMSMYLPDGAVVMTVCPVRCAPLNAADTGQGYFVGAKINAVLEHRSEFEQYLHSLALQNSN